MTGKVINENPAVYLILILPVAATIIFLYEAWLYLLGVLAAVIAWRIWDNYQWQQWCLQVNPLFNQLIKDNQGCLTAMDLTLKGNLSGNAARRFLERKAQEYGAYRRKIQDQSDVYYFITASTLGSIFDNSENFDSEATINRLPASATAAVTIDPPKSTFTPIVSPASVPTVISEPSSAQNPPSIHNAIAQLAQIKEERQQEAQHLQEVTVAESATISDNPIFVDALGATIETPVTEAPIVEAASNQLIANPEVPSQPKSSLIQAELAKRLDTTSSTIARRKSEPDFSIWSQSKDPEGIAWQYLDEQKIFISE